MSVIGDSGSERDARLERLVTNLRQMVPALRAAISDQRQRTLRLGLQLQAMRGEAHRMLLQVQPVRLPRRPAPARR